MTEHKKCPVCRGEPFIKSSHDEDMCYWERVECRKCGLSTRGKWASDRGNACAIFREEVWAEWDDRAEPEREVETVAWIPVSERMPDPWVEVRFYPAVVTEPVIDRGVFDKQGRCWYDEYVPYSGVERVEHKSVTHWQPITAPKEQSE